MNHLCPMHCEKLSTGAHNACDWARKNNMSHFGRTYPETCAHVATNIRKYAPH